MTASRERRMRSHARRLAAVAAGTLPGARLPWLAALIGRRRRLRTLDHYPADDVIDTRSGAQFFVHAHDAASHGFAHFHSFVRLPGRRFGVARRTVTTHLAAVGVDELGWPVRLIAVNQWVTGELWQPARRTLALVGRMRFLAPGPAGDAGRFLAAVVEVFWPELRRLLVRRDERLRRALARRPGENVLQERRLEVLAALPIDLPRRLRALAATSGASASSRRRRG